MSNLTKLSTQTKFQFLVFNDKNTAIMGPNFTFEQQHSLALQYKQ